MSTKILTIGICCLIASFGFAQSANADSAFPAPTILNGPAEGSTINTESTQFVFDYLEPITGGSLTGFLCSLDGAPAVACTSPHDLVGLGVGLHTIGVTAVITPLGGEPLCVLTVCITLPTVALNSEELVRTFSVDTVGASNATTTNNTHSSTTNSDKLGAFALVWGKYKRQQTKCKAMKKRIKKYKTHKNRMRAAKRYKSCVKTQKKLRADALAMAR
jgi:hypothetical protein